MLPPALPDLGGQRAALQQKDNLCGPFQAARALRDAGVTSWDGEELDQDLIALRAGTVLPEVEKGPQVPPGAVNFRDYRFDLPRAAPAEAGTAAGALAEAIEAAAGGALTVVPLRGKWDGDNIERLIDAAPELGARLLANIRTGPLWGSRPPLEALLAALDGEEIEAPAADWDVGHFVELVAPGAREGWRAGAGGGHLSVAGLDGAPSAAAVRRGGRSGARRRARGRGARGTALEPRGGRRDATRARVRRLEHRTLGQRDDRGGNEVATAEDQQVTVEDGAGGWREQGIRNVRFELPDMHGTSRSKLVPIEHAGPVRRDGPEHVRRHGRPRQPLGRRARHALQRGDRLRRPAAQPRPDDRRDRAVGRGDRPA